MSEHWVMGNGTAVIEFGMLLESDLKYGKWYRSKEKREEDNSIGSYVMNKKWWLEEPLKPLSMEHFLFPLILLLAGVFLSTFILVAEIVIRRCGNQQ